MSKLGKFFRKPAADQRMLVRAAVLYVIVAVVVRTLRFDRARRVLERIVALAPRPRDVEDADARIVRAIAAIAALLPDGHCLTDALAAQCLFALYQRETTLCFGVARTRAATRPFDAHAWLESRGATVIGARGIRYDPLHPPHSRCGPSPLLR